MAEKLIKLVRNEPTLPGVNREAEVEPSDLDNWLRTGKWVVVDDEPKKSLPAPAKGKQARGSGRA